MTVARRTILSALSSVMAMLCLTNGLAVPFILAGLSLFLPVPRRTAMMFALIGIAGMIARYALGSVPATVLVAPVLTIVRFGLAMLAGPIASVGPQLAVIVGACVGVGALWAIWQFARTPRSIVKTLLVGNILFLLASAGMAALGRAQFDLSAAAEPRYVQLATIGWVSLLLLALPPGALNRPSGKAIAILLPAVAFAVLPLQVFIGRVWSAKADHLGVASLVLAVGVKDEDWIWRIHPSGISYIDPALPQLRAHDVKFLRYPALGQPTPYVAGSAARCEGTVEATDPRHLSTGLRIRARLRERGQELRIVDRDGRIRGLAKPAPPVRHGRATANDLVWAELDALLDDRATTRDEWIGFAQAGAGPPFRAELLDSEGGLVCEARVTCCADPQAAPVREELILRGGLPEGWLEAANCNMIGGWAWDSFRPTDPIEVRIEISNGSELTTSADAFRPDLLEHGKGDGRHAFVVTPPQLDLGPGRWHVSASIASTGVPLTGSPKAIVCPE